VAPFCWLAQAEAEYNPLVRLVLLLVLATAIPSGDAGARPKKKHSSHDAPTAPAKGVGHLHGTVAWAGRAPEFADEGCAIQDADSAGHPEITGGLAHVVVIAEPLAPQLQKVYRRPPPRPGTPPARLRLLDWSAMLGVPIATAVPGVALSVRSLVTLRFFAGDKLLATLAPSPTDGRIVLPEGIVKVVDERGGLGWIYVTPYPSRISSGTCRFSFVLPAGRYRLRGWHPRAGERSLEIDVPAGDKAPANQLLIFAKS
jgi:hypothetical protein